MDLCGLDADDWSRVSLAAVLRYQGEEDELGGVLSVGDRFGRDQYELLIRQLFHIRQSGAVQEYADRFTGLVDQLLTYGKTTDPLFYALRFVDGLRDDIRSVVHMQ